MRGGRQHAARTRSRVRASEVSDMGALRHGRIRRDPGASEPTGGRDTGAATAEAGLVAVAAATFAGILYKILTAPTMNDLLGDLFGGALSSLF